MKSYDRNQYKATEDGEFKSLPAGAYLAKITSATDDTEKEYLKLEFEITEGEFAGFCSETYQRAKFWLLHSVRSYSEKARPFFNGFITAIEHSNPGFTWAWDEKALVGKAIGLIVGERDYLDKNGDLKSGIEIAQIRSVQTIREGKFKVPEKKQLSAEDKAKLRGNTSTGELAPNDEPLPF
jgi:hypothetical protein